MQKNILLGDYQIEERLILKDAYTLQHPELQSNLITDQFCEFTHCGAQQKNFLPLLALLANALTHPHDYVAIFWARPETNPKVFCSSLWRIRPG
jgi:hypothetical protein